MSHPGIELRIRTPAGVLLQETSDALHWSARWIDPADSETWRQLVDGTVAGRPLAEDVDPLALRFVVEYRPVMLADPADDEDQDDDDEPEHPAAAAVRSLRALGSALLDVLDGRRS